MTLLCLLLFPAKNEWNLWLLATVDSELLNLQKVFLLGIVVATL